MARPPEPLPEHFRGKSFSVAAAVGAGVSRSRTRANDLDSPAYGIRVPARTTLSLAQRCAARATVLPAEAVFSHVTAARLHSMPLPQALEGDVFDVSVPATGRAPRGKQIRGHRTTLAQTDLDRRTGVRATTPIRTFCDLADCLGLAALVAVGDALIRRGSGLHTLEELTLAVATYPGRRHIRRLRRAVELLDQDSESPKESELRVVIIEAGFPIPRCQEAVFDERHRFVARIDLAYPDLKIAIEYEGDHHRDREQWRKDLKRRRRLEALGWVYLSVTQGDLDDSADLLKDLRAAIAARTAARAH